MTEKLAPLEEGLLAAMQAIDSQIAREMQRTPEKIAEAGILKYEAFSKRVERITSFILGALGQREAQLDSVLVLAQSFVKALNLLVEDLGREGLGKVRAGYCSVALDALSIDIRRAIDEIGGSREVV